MGMRQQCHHHIFNDILLTMPGNIQSLRLYCRCFGRYLIYTRFISTNKRGLNPTLQYLRSSVFVFVFPAYTFKLQIWSVSLKRKKLKACSINPALLKTQKVSCKINGRYHLFVEYIWMWKELPLRSVEVNLLPRSSREFLLWRYIIWSFATRSG